MADCCASPCSVCRTIRLRHPRSRSALWRIVRHTEHGDAQRARRHDALSGLVELRRAPGVSFETIRGSAMIRTVSAAVLAASLAALPALAADNDTSNAPSSAPA